MADQPAPTAPGTLFHVGTMPDGRVILSASGDLPVDDTEVWFEDAPDARMTVVELEDANPVAPGTEIAWAAEPQPHQPGAAPAPKSNPAKEPPMGTSAEQSGAPGEAQLGEVDEVPDMDGLEVLDGSDDEDRVAKTAGLTINGEAPTGAMIALVPETPETLADPDGDPPEALHVTLKWLGKADVWDTDERQMIEDIVEAWANRHSAAIEATVAGAGKLGGEGAAVLFLEADELPGMRAKLNDDLAAAFGPDVEDTHPSFIPHLTTGYDVEPRYDLMGDPVSFRNVQVHWGPDIVSFPVDNEIAYIAALGDDLDADEVPEDTGEVDEEGRMAEVAETEEVPEVEVDRMSDLVGEAETKVAELEGMVAELVMAQVSDELFLDAPDDDPLPKVASLTEVDVVDYREALASFRPVASKLAALGDDLPDDLAGRVEALMSRLEALEGSVAEMLLGGMADEEMPELPPGSGTFIDETNPNRPGHENDDDPDEADQDGDEGPGEAPDADQDPEEGDEPDDEDEDDGPPWAKKKRKGKG